MPTKQPADLVGVEVRGLFGQFNHVVDFPEDWDFVIIHGVNGVGKTKVLDLIRTSLTGSVGQLARIPFEQAKLSFSDRSCLTVVRRQEGTGPDDGSTSDRSDPVSLSFEISRPRRSARMSTFTLSPRAVDLRTREIIERHTPLFAIDEDLFGDGSGEAFTLYEVLESFGQYLPPSLRSLVDVIGDTPEGLREFWRGFEVHQIETQRLLARGLVNPTRRARGERETRVATVNKFSDDIAEKIQVALSDLGRKSQELDRTFPSRLVRPQSDVPDEQAVRDRYTEQLRLRRRLTGISVLDALGTDLQLPKENLDPVVLRVMTEFLSDSEAKFRVVEPLLDRLELLTNILNKKFQYKRLEVDRRRGFVVKTRGGEEVRPDQLSSGEQHELVLLYDLLFGAKDDALVLIDEPEISLHVTWQKSFLSDLREVAALTRQRFIVATHSPSIVGKYSDRMVRLEGGE